MVKKAIAPEMCIQSWPIEPEEGVKFIIDELYDTLTVQLWISVSSMLVWVCQSNFPTPSRQLIMQAIPDLEDIFGIDHEEVVITLDRLMEQLFGFNPIGRIDRKKNVVQQVKTSRQFGFFGEINSPISALYLAPDFYATHGKDNKKH